MIVRLAALILLSALPQTKGIPQKIPSIVVKPGDNFTLTCPVSGDEAGLFYWYKKIFGYMIETVAVATLYKMSLQGQFDNPRFNLIKSGGMYFLNIQNVSHEDEGTYLCQSGAAYAMTFTNGTVLTVKDHENQQKSVLMEQIPKTESVPMGYQMSLQCSLLSKNKAQCPGDPDVYWFRAGSGESHPSILYTYNRSSDEQEQRSCVYSLSKTVRDSSDTGTYYCAVVTCGQILFGEGTKVEIKQDLWPFVIVLGALLSCSVVVNLYLLSSEHKPVCKGEGTTSYHTEHDRSAGDQPSNTNDEMEALNYVALDFPSRRRERRMNNRELPQDCVYSS